MRRFTRLMALIMALIFALSCVYLPAGAASDAQAQSDTDASFAKKKVVSILYDNSASMSSSMRDKDYQKEHPDDEEASIARYPYAEYAMRMFIALLGPQDELIVTSMNTNKVASVKGSEFVVDLAADRQDEIDKFNEQFFKNDANSYVSKGLFYQGQTPSETIGLAIEHLVDRGLGGDGSEDTEYWLVILGDGALDNDTTAGYSHKTIASYLLKSTDSSKDFDDLWTDDTSKVDGLDALVPIYPALKTVYLGVGYQAPVELQPPKDGEKPCVLSQKCEFSPYRALSGTDLVGAMQNIANQMSGRFTMESNGQNYKVDGNKLTIDLSNTEYAIASIAAIVQDCGAELLNVEYSGGAVTSSLGCVIGADTAKIKIGHAYSTIIKGSPFMSGGKLTLTYSSDLSPDMISILLEPAIYIKLDLKRKNESGEWVQTTRQEINSEMKPGDKISVGYTAYEMVNNSKINVADLFGEADDKVMYVGRSYRADEEISLVEGNNSIDVSVSLMNGTYTLRDSISCKVESDPTAFRVDTKFPIYNISYGEKTTKTSYEVYYNGSKVGKSTLEANYKLNAEISGSGTKPNVDLSVAADGTINVTVDVSNGAPEGSYQLTVRATRIDTDASGVEFESGFRENKQEFSYTDEPIDLSFGESGTDGSLRLEMSEYELDHNLPDETDTLKSFFVTLGSAGADVIISPDDIGIKVTVDGTDVSKYVQFDGTRIIYSPHSSHFSTTDEEIETKSVVFELSSSRYPNINGKSVTGELVLSKTHYAIVALNNGNNKIDRFDINGSKVTLYFRISRDGKTLSLEETKSSLDSGLVDISIPAVFGFISPAGIETTVEEIDGEATICCRVEKDWIPGLSGVASMFIFNGTRGVSATFRNKTATNVVDFAPSGAWSYIWRVLVIILIVHCVFYIIGFFNGKCKNLPTGYIVVASVVEGMESTLMPTPINKTWWDRWGWHFARFIPIPKEGRPFYYYNQPVPSGEIFFDYTFPQNRNLSYVFESRYNVYRMNANLGGKAGGEVDEWRNRVQIGDEVSLTMTDTNIKKVFKKMPGEFTPLEDGAEADCSTYYGCFDPDTRELVGIVLFIPRI